MNLSNVAISAINNETLSRKITNIIDHYGPCKSKKERYNRGWEQEKAINKQYPILVIFNSKDNEDYNSKLDKEMGDFYITIDGKKHYIDMKIADHCTANNIVATVPDDSMKSFNGTYMLYNNLFSKVALLSAKTARELYEEQCKHYNYNFLMGITIEKAFKEGNTDIKMFERI